MSNSAAESVSESASTATATASAAPIPTHLNPANYPLAIHLPSLNIHLELTYSPLNPITNLSQTRSPCAGANVLFLGTTRDTFANKPVARLSYTSYAPRALRTLSTIAEAAVSKYALAGVSISHRLGEVPVAEESIAIAVSAGHREAAWRAGEEILEECKAHAEIWKREEFVGQEKADGEWRANRDTDSSGKRVVDNPEN